MVAVTARTRCGWVKLRERGKIRQRKKYNIYPKGAFSRAMQGQQFYMEKKHGASKGIDGNLTKDR